jgi:hypothetical protein
MTSIELKDDQLAAVVATSILTSLSEEQRSKLITDAIQNLLNKPSHSGYNAPSHLQIIFNDAVRRVAEKLLESQLAGDSDFATKVRAVATEALDRVFAPDQRDKMVERVAGAIRSSFYGNS